MPASQARQAAVRTLSKLVCCCCCC